MSIIPPVTQSPGLRGSGAAPEVDPGLHEVAYLEGRIMSEASCCPWCVAVDTWVALDRPAGVVELSHAVLSSELCDDCRRLQRSMRRRV